MVSPGVDVDFMDHDDDDVDDDGGDKCKVLD